MIEKTKHATVPRCKDCCLPLGRFCWGAGAKLASLYASGRVVSGKMQGLVLDARRVWIAKEWGVCRKGGCVCIYAYILISKECGGHAPRTCMPPAPSAHWLVEKCCWVLGAIEPFIYIEYIRRETKCEDVVLWGNKFHNIFENIYKQRDSVDNYLV